MESPPRPKRIVESLENIQFVFPETLQGCSGGFDNVKVETESFVGPTVALQSLSPIADTSTVSKPVANEAPNLCAFVNEVAAQQQQQIDELDAQKQLLELRKNEVAFLKNLQLEYRNEAKSIKRKTFLAQEETNVLKLKIKVLRDEILLLLAQEGQLQKLNEDSQLATFKSFKEAYQNKMHLHEEKIKARSLNTEIGKSLKEAKGRVLKLQKDKQSLICVMKNQYSLDEPQLLQKSADLKCEKTKLLGILQRKKKSLLDEENCIQSLSICVENSQKRIAAQKLRLRSRIGEKRRLMQQYEQEAVSLQIEIDDIIVNQG